MNAVSPPPGPTTGMTIWQGLVSLMKTVGVVGVVLLAAFFVARSTGIFDRHVRSERVTMLSDWQSGVAYRLNRVVLDVRTTVEITACGTVSINALAGDPDVVDGKANYRLVNISVTDSKVAPRLEPDPTHAWVIQPDTIEGVWWSTTFTATTDALGRLKEINSTSTTLPAGEVLKPILALADQFKGPATQPVKTQAAADASALTDGDFCGHAIRAALARRAEINGRLASAPAGEKEVLQGELDKGTAVLRGHFHRTLVPRRPAAALDMATATEQQLLEHGLGVFVDPAKLFSGLGAGLQRELGDRAFEIRILAALAPVKDPSSPVNGIVHRIPAEARVVTCRKRCEVDTRGEVPAHNLLKGPETVSIPQLGVDAVVPIRRTPFSDRKAKLTFDTNGMLTIVDVTDTAQLPK